MKLGVHTLTGEKVAVKILEKERIKDSSDVERVSREIKILKQVNHPNIVRLYEIIETSKQLYLIMEYASGGELFDYIVARSRLKESQACIFLQQLLSGIEYLHTIKVVHRDLKPENLLLDDNNNLKIVDFGLSNMYRGEETLKTACGSPCYAAPEMIAGKRYQGSRVDVWSCGVVLFAMICGYLPFEDPNTSSLYRKIIAGDFKCGSWVSNEAQDILRKILNTNPDTRFTVEMIRNHPWFIKFSVKQGPKEIKLDPPVIDEKILKYMESFGFSHDSVRESIEKNKHNKYTSTYYLLLKKNKNTEASNNLNTKIGSNALPAFNSRGDSHSINPRTKKLFEFKAVEKLNSLKEHENAMRITNYTIVREIKYPTTTHRKTYGHSPNGYRDPRAASTGFHGQNRGTVYIPRDNKCVLPAAKITSKPVAVKAPPSNPYEIAAFNSSLRRPNSRAGTALDFSIGKVDPKNLSFR